MSEQSNEYVSGREFARRMGWAPSYVSKLRSAGRLVIVDDKVDVQASLRRLEETADPDKDAVREMNEERRAGDADDTRKVPEGGLISDNPGEDGEASPGGSDSSDVTESAAAQDKKKIVFADEKARNEFYKAEQAELEYRRRAAELVEASDVKRIAAQLGQKLQNELLSLPPELAPILAPITDDAEIDRRLEAAMLKVLQELAIDARKEQENNDEHAQRRAG